MSQPWWFAPLPANYPPAQYNLNTGRFAHRPYRQFRDQHGDLVLPQNLRLEIGLTAAPPPASFTVGFALHHVDQRRLLHNIRRVFDEVTHQLVSALIISGIFITGPEEINLRLNVEAGRIPYQSLWNAILATGRQPYPPLSTHQAFSSTNLLFDPASWALQLTDRDFWRRQPFHEHYIDEPFNVDCFIAFLRTFTLARRFTRRWTDRTRQRVNHPNPQFLAPTNTDSVADTV